MNATAACALLLLLVTSAGAPQIAQTQKIALPYPTLEVREFSTEFAQWGRKGSLNAGGFAKEFRWTTTRTGVISARYEVSVFGFPDPLVYQQALVIAKGVVPLPTAPGALRSFTIDFGPLMNQIKLAPSPVKTVFVRVVTSGRGLEFSPVSPTVTLEYEAPPGGTKLDSSMSVRLKSVRCVETTSGPGSDEIKVRIIGVNASNFGVANNLFSQLLEEFDAGDTVTLDAVIHQFNGLSLPAAPRIVIGLAEDDDPVFGQSVNIPGLVLNGPDPVAGLRKVLCEGDHDDDECLGLPQVLSISHADWNNTTVKNQIVTKTLTFKGDGGHYEVVFELRKS